MTLIPHSNYRRLSFQRAFILLAILCIISACCCPVSAARDVRVAMTELKPTLFIDEDGKPAGFMVDLIEELAMDKGWNVMWVRGTLSDNWERLSRGEIDLMSAVTVTPERLELYDFTNVSVLSIWSQVYTRPDAGINTILDLDGKQVAMVRGASSGIGFKDYTE